VTAIPDATNFLSLIFYLPIIFQYGLDRRLIIAVKTYNFNAPFYLLLYTFFYGPFFFIFIMQMFLEPCSKKGLLMKYPQDKAQGSTAPFLLRGYITSELFLHCIIYDKNTSSSAFSITAHWGFAMITVPSFRIWNIRQMK